MILQIPEVNKRKNLDISYPLIKSHIVPNKTQKFYLMKRHALLYLITVINPIIYFKSNLKTRVFLKFLNRLQNAFVTPHSFGDNNRKLIKITKQANKQCADENWFKCSKQRHLLSPYRIACAENTNQ